MSPARRWRGSCFPYCLFTVCEDPLISRISTMSVPTSAGCGVVTGVSSDTAGCEGPYRSDPKPAYERRRRSAVSTRAAPCRRAAGHLRPDHCRLKWDGRCSTWRPCCPEAVSTRCYAMCLLQTMDTLSAVLASASAHNLAGEAPSQPSASLGPTAASPWRDAVEGFPDTLPMLAPCMPAAR
jgi:hypothetical protein